MYSLRNKQKIRTLFLLGKFGSDFSGLVPVTGLEPVRCCHRGILSPLRLPISPHRRVSIDFEYYTVIMGYCQGFSGNFCFIFKCF